MAIRVLSFDPTKQVEIEQFEKDLDFYLSDGWEVLTTMAGNRPGVDGNLRSFRSDKHMAPSYKDYIVFVLRHTGATQAEMENTEVARRSQ